MAGPLTSELRLSASKDQAVQAIRKALPGDAVVRGEDDGVGRFASDRTVMIVGRGEKRLMLFQGSWRFVKARESKPQLDVVFEEGDDGLSVRLTRAATKKTGGASRVIEVVGNMATVAALVIAYYWFRKIPLDQTMVIGIAVGGGLAWTLVARFWPKKENAGLEGMVRRALRPLLAETEPSAEVDAEKVDDGADEANADD